MSHQPPVKERRKGEGLGRKSLRLQQTLKKTQPDWGSVSRERLPIWGALRQTAMVWIWCSSLCCRQTRRSMNLGWKLMLNHGGNSGWLWADYTHHSSSSWKISAGSILTPTAQGWELSINTELHRRFQNYILKYCAEVSIIFSYSILLI